MMQDKPLKDGIISVYKPSGMTSNDVIYKMRAILGIKKIGHTGTLDPMATGVLPVCINKSTRAAEYLDEDFKTYKATMKLGIITTTLDMTGAVEEMRDTSHVTEPEILKALFSQTGLIDQLPPLISAIRINGRRLYEFIHDGEEIPPEIAEKIKPRKVLIKDITVNLIDMGSYGCSAGPVVKFTVTCSKGTYIRSIARDVGEILGCGASLENLERTASGVFTKENSVPLSELIEIARCEGLIEMMEAEDGTAAGGDFSKMPAEYMIKRLRRFGDEIPEAFKEYVYGTDFPLTHFGKAIVSPKLARKFIDGWHLGYNEIEIAERPKASRLASEAEALGCERIEKNDGSTPGIRIRPEYAGMYRIYSSDGSFIGIAKHSEKYKKLVCDKIFYRI